MECCRETDEQKFGPPTLETIDLIQNFCCMHLGINLRKAFLCGMKLWLDGHGHCTGDSHREYHPVDTLVHEFCKLFGKSGVPEYGCGSLAFPDFLAVMLRDPSLSEDTSTYFQACATVKLDRQVGSRYFVTAANAGKIILLKDAAIQFLRFTGKDNGNKLERDVYRKLLDPSELANLKADALMFYHVYADLVMLAKSNELGKSTFDMSQHYLELQMFLREVENYPEVTMESNYKVFRSEERLYGSEKKVNHCLHVNSQDVHKRLLSGDDADIELLYPILTAGASSMREKLSSYAQNQLPGGIYWDPEPTVERVLRELKPSNDLCESILGLNDYLSTAIPNMHQMTRSNLVEVKKNKTIKWLNALPGDQQEKVVDFAVKNRSVVLKEYREKEEARCSRRRERMLQEKQRKDALRLRAERERGELSKLHVIASSEELALTLADIDEEECTVSKKKLKKLTVLKNQVKLRKKVLNQDIRINFTKYRRQRPLSELVKELSDFIDQNSVSPTAECSDPASLVGKHILHKFELEETREERWYRGRVLGYNAASKLHTVLYDGEEDECYFDLRQDLLVGDLKVVQI